MNIHHLELFYYVARHGGIMEAVRRMPYGIQQPAMSAQIRQLEEHLGVTLFQRRPFALTAAGQELYESIRPFFDNLGPLANKIRGGLAQPIAIGGSEIVMRDHMPVPLENVRKRFPQLKVALRVGHQPQLENWLQMGELDLAITVVEGRPPPGLRSMPLIKVPLVLLVRKNGRLQSADDLWKLDRIDETLICLPSTETLCKKFQQRLAEIDVEWFPGIEVSSMDILEAYVANGYGIGLGVAVPKRANPTALRAVPLPGFQPLTFGALWRGKPTPVIQAFLDEFEALTRRLVS